MSGNPALSPFSGWNEAHGGSMGRNSSSKQAEAATPITAHEFCNWLQVTKGLRHYGDATATVKPVKCSPIA